ncbi:hypothetical protein [Haloarchaeobius amylolyticus]|uniref:hypothetical protein n=1 Tax=Haloarchaeobius amylolyticus TaxID=1198296 RepID=UPI002271B8FE|nr:hypothetical protein [Haloarchaeobius amylolyticus]
MPKDVISAADTDTVRTEQLTVERLRGRTSIVLGAPYIGKTERLRTLATETDAVTFCGDLDEAATARSDALVILDDFYDAFLRATPDERAALPDLLDRTGGICLSTRPRSLDWLLEQERSGQNPDGGLDEEYLESVEQLLLIEYDPTEDTTAVVDAIRSLDDDLDGFTISNELDRLEYPSYTFDSEPLASAVDSYGPTVVPWLVGYLSIAASSNGSILSVDGAVDAVREFGENFSLSRLINDVQDSASELLSADGLHLTGLSLMGTVPVAGAGALAVWLLLRDDEPPTGDIFDRILEEELDPLAAERIEAQLGLPPKTLENLETLTSSGNLHRLQCVCEEFPELRADVTESFAAHEETLARLERSLADLEARVGSISERTALVSESLGRAVDDIDRLDRRVREDESRILQLEIDDVSRVLETYVGDEPDEILDAVDEHDLILLRGPHGTGKTTAALRACRELRDRGHEVRLPNFEAESVSLVRHGLRATQEQPIVFTSYRVGTAAFRQPVRLKNLLDWLGEGTCGTVIVECREDFYEELLDAKRTLGLGPTEEARWSARAEIEFDRFDDEAGGSTDGRRPVIERISGWVLDELDHQGDREAVIREATELAQGNPEIAKIATRFAVLEDRPLSDVDSPHDLIWSDVEPLFGEDVMTVEGIPVGKAVFGPLCALRETTTDELLAVTGPAVDAGHLARSVGPLSGYLRGDVVDGTGNDGVGGETPSLAGDETWEVTPDIYAEVVFREQALRNGDLGTYLTRARAAGSTGSYLRLSLSLALAYLAAERWDQQGIQPRVAQQSGVLLDSLHEGLSSGDLHDRLGDEVFFSAVRGFAIGRLPIESTLIEAGASRLKRGVGIEAERSGIPGDVVLANILGLLAVNHIEADDHEEATAVFEVGQTLWDRRDAGFIATELEFDVRLVATAVLRLADRRGLDEILAVFEEVLSTVPETLLSDSQITDLEMRNTVLTALISALEQRRDDPDIQDHVRRLFEGISSDGSPMDHTTRLTHAASGTLGMVATRPSIERSTEDARGWVDTVWDAARAAAGDDLRETEFDEHGLGNAVGYIIAETIRTRTAATVEIRPEPWIDATLEAAVDREPPNAEGIIYLVNVCTNAVGRFVDLSSPDDAGHWVAYLVDTLRRVREFESDRAEGALFANLYATLLKLLYLRMEQGGEERDEAILAAFDPSDVDQYSAWFDHLGRRVVADSASAYHTSEFLYNSMGGAIAKTAEDTTVAEASDLPDRMLSLLRASLAESEVVDVAPDEAVVYTYVSAFQMIERKDNAGRDWIAHLASRAAATQDEHGRLRDIVGGGIDALAERPGPESPLTQAILEQTEADLSLADIGQVYAGLLDQLDAGDTGRSGVVWCVTEFLERTGMDGSFEATDVPDEWIDACGAVFAAAVDRIWLRADFDHPAFDSLRDEVGRIREQDAETAEAVVEATATTLEDTHDNLIAALDWRETVAQ